MAAILPFMDPEHQDNLLGYASILFPVKDITEISSFRRQIGRPGKFWSAPSNRFDPELKKRIKPLSDRMQN
jgi:hypothetical protein